MRLTLWMLGCSCGVSFDHLEMRHLEQDVLDYYLDKYSRAGATSLVRLLHSCAGSEQSAEGSMARLLDKIVDAAGLHPNDAELLICDLTRTIGSLMPTSRFSADV